MSFIDNLQWRYATKKMNGQKVEPEKVQKILDAVYYTPSSSGLQPFEVFVISNKEMLGKIKTVANNQPQITECSELLVFAAWKNYTKEAIDDVFAYVVEQRQIPAESVADYKNMLWSMYSQMTEEQHFAHTAKQTYIALGFALAAAAELKVDSTPMEGFDHAGLDKLLELDKKGLKSTLIMPIGYRDEANDWLVNMKKVRPPRESFFTEIK